MNDREFVISISEAAADESSDVSVFTWKVPEAYASQARTTLTLRFGEPLSGIISEEVVHKLDHGPGVVLLDEGDQT